MIGWDAFIYFAVPVLGCWLASGTAALKGCRRTAIWAGTTGCIVFAAFMTMPETTVHENDGSVFAQDQVGMPGKAWIV